MGKVPGSARLIDGVDAIAAAALGDVESVIEDGEATEVGVFARLVGAELQTPDHLDVRWERRRYTGVEQLGARRIDQVDPSLGDRDLLLGEVARVVVADHVVEAVAALDGRAAIIAAIGVARGDAEMAVGVHFGDRAVVGRGNHGIAGEGGDDWIGGIADARRVGSRNIEQVGRGGRNRGASASDAADVAHEGDGAPVNGAVQGQLRLGAEAGHDLIGGDGEGSQLSSHRS